VQSGIVGRSAASGFSLHRSGTLRDMDLEMTDVMKNKFEDMEKQLLKELAIYNVVPEKI